MSRLVVALAVWLLAALQPEVARAESPVQSDNQYDVPVADPTALIAQESPAEDGRFALELRGAFGKGLQVRPSSDLFAIQVRGRIQFRGELSYPVGQGGDARPAGLVAIRRARIVIGGHLLGRQLSYYVQLGLGPYDLERELPIPLRDAFFTWHFPKGHVLEELNVRFGQQKVPFDRQRVTSSSKQQLVDRSLAAAELNLDRDIGVQIFSNDVLGLGWLSYQVGAFQGDGRNRINTDLGGLVMGRVQVTPLGEQSGLSEGDGGRSPRPNLAFAAAGGYNHQAPRLQSTLGTYDDDQRASFAHLTADFVFKWAGVSATGAVLYRQALRAFDVVEGAAHPVDCRAEAPEGFFCPSSGVGGYLQAGWFVVGSLEVAARAGYLETWDNTSLPWHPDEGRPPDVAWIAELGGGMGLYLLGHDLKLQADGFLLPSSDGVDARLRAQLQVYF